MFPIKKIIEIDRDISKKTSLGCHLVSFRYGDHNLGFQTKGRETIALVFAQPVFLFLFSILTKLAKKSTFCPKWHIFGLILPDFGVHFSRSPTTFLILVKEKKNRNEVCDSLGPGDHGCRRLFFSVCSISKVINRKQNGHIVPHGPYAQRYIQEPPSPCCARFLITKYTSRLCSSGTLPMTCLLYTSPSPRD